MRHAESPSKLRLAATAIFTALVGASCTPLLIDSLELSSDEMDGRNNGTSGSAAAREYLIERMSEYAIGLDQSQSGTAAFEQSFAQGTNVLGLIPGSDLADEYVIVGAHYDHLGHNCTTSDPSDTICNGATDNAAGAAAVLDIGRSIATRPEPPRRSVILAFWDAEEDGLLGSYHYVQNPLVPLSATAAYVNFDIVGANLLPSLRTTTFVVGAESGGAELTSQLATAIDTQPLRVHALSAVFGQGRSDYQQFLNAGVPTVFFSDSTGPCYHTAQDEFSVIDQGKLYHQTNAGAVLTQNLADADSAPTYASAELATYDDAVALAEVFQTASADFSRFSASQQESLFAFEADLASIVAAGPAAFDDDDVNTLLFGTLNAINILSTGQCDAFRD